MTARVIDDTASLARLRQMAERLEERAQTLHEAAGAQITARRAHVADALIREMVVVDEAAVRTRRILAARTAKRGHCGR